MTQHIILFYKYHPLHDDRDIVEEYRNALETFCQSLQLQGRILIGCSQTEGINGTLAGTYSNVLAFTRALQENEAVDDSPLITAAVQTFRQSSKEFFDRIHTPELLFDSPEHFKWSSTTSSEPVFPDLHIKLVKELISTGGILSQIPISDTGRGYLEPHQFKERLETMDEDTLLIDCRNTKEHSIGHFEHSLDPSTTSFSQFPQWVQNHQSLLDRKKILLYCTGGIRCEKSAAYIRQHTQATTVHHLRGGIHKYLEYSVDHWRGKNFVFHSGECDGVETTTRSKHVAVVGKCVYCSAPYDTFDPHCVCTVCREPVLVCQECQTVRKEFHCTAHTHLRKCYFSHLTHCTESELKAQRAELGRHLQDIAVGRKFKQRRKTLQKQIAKINRELAMEFRQDNTSLKQDPGCRNCGQSDCSGRCWGFFGLARKYSLQQKQPSSLVAEMQPPQTQTQSKRPRRDRDGRDILPLDVFRPPCDFRDAATSVRVPPCCTRMLTCTMKGKWCGTTIRNVVTSQFHELNRPNVLETVVKRGLLKINNEAVSISDLENIKLKASDVLGRVVHWHEAPVIVPQRIPVETTKIPEFFMPDCQAEPRPEDGLIFVCNKPSSVPVHPAGPYLANTLTLMVEAQEGFPPMSLTPLHRTDRVTSGLTLCTRSPTVTRIFQRSLSNGLVNKLYLALVHGKFPSSAREVDDLPEVSVGSRRWNGETLHVDAPIYTQDPSAGIRTVDKQGKDSKSVYRLLEYDSEKDTSLLACYPISGRNHQLRVHLRLLSYPIIGDLQYGGRPLADRETLSIDATNVMSNRWKQAVSLEDERRANGLSDIDVQEARLGCRICTTGLIQDAFTPAQLLQSGHCIRLHALRYRVKLCPKKQKHDEENLSEMVFDVAPPEWASDSALSDLAWPSLGDP